MEELKAKAEQLTQDVGDMLDTYYQLSIVKIAEKTTDISIGLFSVLIISLISLSVFLFIGIGLSVWMGELLNSTIAGYLVVALFYIVLMVLYILLGKKTIHPIIRNIVVRKLNL